MRYIDEFRDRRLIDRLALQIRKAARRGSAYTFMEVCGTHTMNAFRFGLREILPPNIELVSGPGCPVCVTPNDYIDKAIWLSKLKDVIITTFGDMFRVPGSYSSLEKERAKGAGVKTVYSTIDALDIAKRNPAKEVVFLGIGFETTAPTVARSILLAKKEGIKNYSVLSGHKTMPAALDALAGRGDINCDGFLLPGHVSAVIGVRPYGFMASRHGKRCVIAGFEPVDILQAILMLIKQDRPKVEVQYTRIINRSGNALARKTMKKVFRESSSMWRGIGQVKHSGLRIRDEFSCFDAESKFKPRPGPARENKNCICGEVLKGIRIPTECALFGRSCVPDNPVGACMVSSEGTCAAYYKYNTRLVDRLQLTGYRKR